MTLCECGCGNATPLAQRTCRRDGRIKGQPLRFLHGHNRARRAVSESARRLVDDFHIAANNVAAGYSTVDVGEAAKARLVAYITDLEDRASYAEGENVNLLDDRRTLLRELGQVPA